MSWFPHVTVAAVIEKQRRFLLVEEQSDGLVVFNQPAGHVEIDEDICNATIRETFEETGWYIEPLALVGIYQWKSPLNDITYFRFCLHAQAIEEETQAKLDEGIIGTVWWDTDTIKKNQKRLRSPMVQQCINDYLNGQRYPLSLVKNLSDQIYIL